MNDTRPSELRRALAFLTLMAYAGLIFRVSSGPVPDSVLSLGAPDYLLHLAEYALLGLLVARWVFVETSRSSWPVLVAIPAMIAAAYGTTDEIHQSFVEVRDASFSDVWADTLGGAAGAGLYWLLFVRRRIGLRGVFAAIVGLALLAGVAKGGEPKGTDLEANRRMLESPELREEAGPYPGSALAARYAASVLERLGFEPAGEGGTWFIEEERSVREDRGESLVRLLDGDRVKELTGVSIGRGSPARTAAGPLAFAGLCRERAGRDDFEGIDVRGRVLLALPGSSLEEMAGAAAARGAVGLLVARGPEGERRWSEVPEAPLAVPALLVSDEVAEALLRGTGRNLAGLAGTVPEGPVSFPVPGKTVVVRVGAAESAVRLRHVAARLPGAFPGKECVVLQAEYGASDPAGENWSGGGASVALALAGAASRVEGGPARTLFVVLSPAGGLGPPPDRLLLGERVSVGRLQLRWACERPVEIMKRAWRRLLPLVRPESRR